MIRRLIIRERGYSTLPIRIDISRISVIIYTLMMFAGNYGLDKIDSSFSSLGELQYLRMWFTILLFPLTAVYLIQTKYIHINHGTVHKWVVAIAILHLYLAMSSLWSPNFNLSLQQ